MATDSDEIIFQAMHDTRSGAGTVPVSASPLYFRDPVMISKDNLDVEGLGKYQSVTQTAGRFPAFVIGVQPKANDGVGVNDSNRPSGAKVYDSSVGPAWGFATRGRFMLTSKSSQFTLGKWTPTGWDYGAGLPRTWRGMFEHTGPPLTAGLPLGGSGDYAGSKPSSFLHFLSADHPGMMGVSHILDGDPETTNDVFYIDLGGFSGVKRWEVKLTERGWSANVNGKAVTPVWDYRNRADTRGKSLARQTFPAPWLWGSTGFTEGIYPPYSATDLVVYAYWHGATDVPEPGNDHDRYFKEGPETLAFIDFRIKRPGPWLQTWEGDRMPVGGGSTNGRILIYDSFQNLHRQTTGTSLKGFSVTNGGVLIHKAFSTKVEDFRFVGGRCGLATMGVNSYRLSVTDGELAGDDAAADWYSVIGKVDGVDLSGGGDTVVRSVGTRMDWRSILVKGFGAGGARYVFAFLPTDDGCNDSLGHVMINNEIKNAFSVAAVYAKNGTRYKAKLAFDFLAVVPVDGCPVFRLDGTPGRYPGAVLRHSMMTLGSPCAAPVQLDGTGQWTVISDPDIAPQNHDPVLIWN